MVNEGMLVRIPIKIVFNVNITKRKWTFYAVPYKSFVKASLFVNKIRPACPLSISVAIGFITL